MSHKKAAGSTKNGRDSNARRLGVKVFGGQQVAAGDIILRQQGNKFFPGENVGQGRDFTLYAETDGTVAFTEKRNKKFDGRVYRNMHVHVQQ